MVLYGAARRSRVRRIVLLAHTFGYAVFLGVVACVVDVGALRGFLVGVACHRAFGDTEYKGSVLLGGGGTYYVLTGVSRL